MKNLKIAYVVSDLKRVGPTNQTLNIIKYSKFKDSSIVITLFEEDINDTMIEEYKDNGIKIICLNLNRITFIVTGKRKLSNILKKEKIDIVHSYGIKPDCICYKVCEKLHTKHVITLRNYPKEDILSRMNLIKGQIALHSHLNTLKNAKNIVACSKTIEKKMKNDYPNMNIISIQNGVDTNIFFSLSDKEKKNMRNKYKFPLDKKIYISTNSFIPRKRINETIDGYLLANVENSLLIMLGEGPLFDKIKCEYDKFDNIIFIGKTNNVVDYLQLSDVFISSSESEGLPNSVLEAIACGLPVILSDIPQHMEILDEINVGKYYHLGDIDELVFTIIYNHLKNNNGIKNSSFTMYNMSNKYLDYYKKNKKGI